jgi:hypothetical protein
LQAILEIPAYRAGIGIGLPKGRRTIRAVETFNNRRVVVATVNFSVPEEVKKAFDRTFRNRNKSAIIADLMRRAVADEGLRKRRLELFKLLTERRDQRPKMTAEQLHEARIAGRP